MVELCFNKLVKEGWRVMSWRNPRRLIDDQKGATAIEYGLIAALIAVAIIGAVSFTGNGVAELYNYWTDGVSNALNNP